MTSFFQSLAICSSYQALLELQKATMSFKALTLWIIWLGLIELSLGARVRHYKFDVEYMIRKPDCLEHVVMGINGQFPGPTIRAEVGDTLDIALTNKLSEEGTVIHWHGIRQVSFFFCFKQNLFPSLMNDILFNYLMNE